MSLPPAESSIPTPRLLPIVFLQWESDVAAVLTVADDGEKLHWALRHANELGDLVIGTGGLGSTAGRPDYRSCGQISWMRTGSDERVAKGKRGRFEEKEKKERKKKKKKTVLGRIGDRSLSRWYGLCLSCLHGRGKTLFWLSCSTPRDVGNVERNGNTLDRATKSW